MLTEDEHHLQSSSSLVFSQWFVSRSSGIYKVQTKNHRLEMAEDGVKFTRNVCSSANVIIDGWI